MLAAAATGNGAGESIVRERHRMAPAPASDAEAVGNPAGLADADQKHLVGLELERPDVGQNLLATIGSQDCGIEGKRLLEHRHVDPLVDRSSISQARQTATRPWWERYVGLPFGEGAGEVTCWSLVVKVYAEQLGIELPAYGEISARDLIRIARAMKAGSTPSDGWAMASPPRAFDVALMRGPRGGAVVHVGVMVDDRRLLHVEEASAAVVVPVDHWSVSGRILGYRRRA